MAQWRHQGAAPQCLRRERERGYTLIELLVSLAVMAMTAMLLVAGLGTGRNLWQRAEAQAVAGESIEAATRLLRDRIEASVAESRFDATPPYVDIRGDEREFSFYAPAAQASPMAGLMRYRLRLTPGGTVTLFAVDAQSARVDPHAPSLVGWTATPLIGGVRALDLNYFGAGPPDNVRRWRTAWLERPNPPELVRVRIEFAAGDPRRWPDLIIRPVATIGSACRFDSASGRCQGAS
jgi:general secretion pathway protein J